MSELTVVVTAGNSAAGLKYTLESIVEQTVEDFKVIIVQNGESDDVRKTAAEYAGEYVGFSLFEMMGSGIPACRNFAAGKCVTPYIMFIDGGDRLSHESVENILAVIKERHSDIVTTRYYVSGEGEPYYEHWNELLAPVPDIDRFDRALFNSMETEGRVYSKKFFDLYSARFDCVSRFYNTAFLSRCVFDYGASLSGCAGAVYERANGVYSCGFTEGAEPNKENLSYAVGLFNGILDSVKSLVKDSTGAFDGDEYAFQEMLSVFFGVITDNFYRYFWYITDEVLDTVRLTLESISASMTAERRNKISEEYYDLRFPSMYLSHADAVKMPMFSLIADKEDAEELADFIASLYISRFPFFELFLKESVRENLPESLKKYPNIRFLPNDGFFAAARSAAAGFPIAVKDVSPVDTRTLSEMSVSKAPKGLLQHVFMAKRKKYATKPYFRKNVLNTR